MAKKRSESREVTEPEPLPELEPEARLSHYMDYAGLVPDYQRLVAEAGEAQAQETLDYFFYFLLTSNALLAEREFADWRWPLDPHDYLVYELIEHIQSQAGQSLEGLGPSIEDPLFRHMIHDGLHRYFTPVMRRALARRARNLRRRAAGRVLSIQADAVVMAAEDLRFEPFAMGLLVESFRRALLLAARDLSALFQRERERRNPALDRYLDEIRAADHEHPADEAVRRLVQAGPQALGLAQHLLFEEDWACDDYPVRAALQVVVAFPSHRALQLLLWVHQACPTLRQWAAGQMAARMPELACAYFTYLLTAPRPAPSERAASGLWVLAQTRCPEALRLAALALDYRVDDAAATEEVQVAAWQALLALDDPAAVPALRAYLAAESAHPAAREELVRTLERRGEGWWTAVLQPEAEPSPA